MKVKRKQIVCVLIATVVLALVFAFVYRVWSRWSYSHQLVDAARGCDTSRLQSLLAAGASPNVPAVKWKGWTVGEPYREQDYALSVAASRGCVEGMKLLVENGALLEVEDSEGMNSLALAARWGQSTAVEYLLDVGADVQHTDDAGRTALHWAARYGEPESVRLLLSSGAAARRTDLYGYTPKELAEKRSDKDGRDIVQIFSALP